MSVMTPMIGTWKFCHLGFSSFVRPNLQMCHVVINRPMNSLGACWFLAVVLKEGIFGYRFLIVSFTAQMQTECRALLLLS